MKVAAIVQARMGSTRLPGKVLLPVLGKPLLQIELERIGRSQRIDHIMVATTRQPEDERIIQLCRSLGVECFRGPEHDVLTRYFEAAKNAQADVIVRLTADCPLLDPQIIDDVISSYISAMPPCDYCSNTLVRSYPRGLDTEVFSFAVLQRAYEQAQSPAEREHVTPFIVNRPELFRLVPVLGSLDFSHHRWTVDTIDDYRLVRQIIERLYPANPLFTMNDVTDLLELESSWPAINAHVEQKSVERD